MSPIPASRPSRDPMVKNVIVSNAFDAADNWIAEHAGPGDIVVTADVPLAGRCVSAGALVTGPTGRVFDNANIGMATAMRDLGAHLRETGEKQGLQRRFLITRPFRLSRNLRSPLPACQSS